MLLFLNLFWSLRQLKSILICFLIFFVVLKLILFVLLRLTLLVVLRLTFFVVADRMDTNLAG